MESIRLDLVPDGAMPELHASQYDKGRRFRLNLLDFGIDYTLDGTETLTIEERKVDGNICVRVVANTFSGKKYVEFTTTEQMCACAGYNLCELHIVKGEDSIGTLNFVLVVEISPIEGGLSGSEIENLYTQIDERVDVDVADIMDDYYKKSETYSSEEIDNALALKANVSDVYNKTEIDTALALKANTSDVNTALALKADKATTYNKTEVDNLVAPKADKSYVDSELATKANTADVYNKTEADALLANKANASDFYTDITAFIEKTVSTISTKYQGYNGAAYSNGIGLGALANYDSYAFYIENNTQIYVDATNIAYFAISIGINPSPDGLVYNADANTYYCDCASASRVRKSENNLPTSGNPLSVTAGTILVFTVTKNTVPTVYIKESLKELSYNRVIVSVSSDKVTIKGTNYEVEFSKLTTTQGYQWNITSLKGKRNNMFPAGVDIIGVIQFVGKNNFMGGGHGNESNYLFKVLSNGNSVSGVGSYEEIHIVMDSHLYDVDNTSQNVVDRFVEFVFNSSGWTCRNTFKVLIDTQIQVAYCSGLFAFNASDCDGAYSNVGELDVSSTMARQLKSSSFREITINLPNDFTVNINSETADEGFVVYRSNTQSFKVYFANAQEETVVANTFISGKCTYRF